MAKRGRHRRNHLGPSPAQPPPPAPWGRPPGGWAPFTGPGPVPVPVPPPAREPDLVVDVRRMLRADRPLDLLVTVSAMLALVDPRTGERADRPPAHRSRHPGHDELAVDTLLQSFVEVRVPESTALLAALAALAPQAEVRDRAAAEVAVRRDPLPAWVAGLGHARLHRAVVLSHVRGDSDNIMAAVRLPPGHEFTVSVHIDHALGSVVADGVAVAASLVEVLDRIRGALDDPDTRLDVLDLGALRARVSQAVDDGARLVPPIETDDWPRCRPLVEWAVRLPA